MNVLYAANRACRACPMRNECEGPVPAEGPMDAKVALIGEAPGRNEDRLGRPWMGAAGQFLMSLLRSIGLTREQVWLSNMSKCRPKGNRTPTIEEAKFCASRWLEVELNMVNPRVIGLLGDVATSYFLGPGAMYERHGKPYDAENGLPILLPMYHPAAGLHDKGENRLSQIMEDFKVLGEVVRGEWKPVVDEYPEPDYVDVDEFSLDEAEMLRGRLYRDNPTVEAVDTETVNGKLWSVQLSSNPGSGLFIPKERWNFTPPSGRTCVVHNYMYDARFIDLPPNTKDTMVMAYLLGLPQGLKELAKRLCGMEMQSYTEMTREYGKGKAMTYLEEAVALHPDSPPTKAIRDKAAKKGETLILDMWKSLEEVEDATWNKKNQQFEIKKSKPQHIVVKMKKILADVRGGKELKDGPVDPFTRWNAIDSRERRVVENDLGPMPEGTLEDAPRESAVSYSCRDADATGRIYPILWQQILDKGLLPVFMMDMGTLPIALEMEKNGIKIDVGKLKELGDRFVGMLQEKSEEIFETANVRDIDSCLHCEGNGGSLPAEAEVSWRSWVACSSCEGKGFIIGKLKRFNPNSNKELATLFFTDLGFTPTKYTPTGEPSVARGELAKIDHPVVGMIEDYRHIQHLKDSFCDTLPGKADSNGRVHPTIKTTRTATGRWAMEDPNCQQIPSRDELGKEIRKAFIAENGNVLVSIDHSQIEMRVQAHVAQCKSMIQIFQEGRHIHRETCAEIYGISLANVNQDGPEYKATKNIGFGVMYLETEEGLFTQMKREKAEGWDTARCRAFIKDWYKLRPEVWTWQQETIAFARRNGYVKSIMGRIREIPECLVPIDWIQSQGDRQAVNMPIQGTAQDILKQAMVKLWSEKPDGEEMITPWRWLLQVHDELIWEVKADYADRLIERFSPIMGNIVKLSVPLEVEAKVGLNWGEMVKR